MGMNTFADARAIIKRIQILNQSLSYSEEHFQQMSISHKKTYNAASLKDLIE